VVIAEREQAEGGYPEPVAQSHMGNVEAVAASGLVTWNVGDELGLQAHFLAPPEIGQDLLSEDSSATTSDESAGRPAEGIQLTLSCPSWAMRGKCEEEHYYAKELICNREWCRWCGGDGGLAHQRRISGKMSKARQMKLMGKFVITVPPEVRDRYRDPRKLAALGVSFKRMFQDHGFSRGLRRFHFFGEDHSNHGGGGPDSGLPSTLGGHRRGWPCGSGGDRRDQGLRG